LFYSIDMIELLLPCGFDTLEYSWVKATIGICTPVDYSMAKKRQLSANTFHTSSFKHLRNITGRSLVGVFCTDKIHGG
jgi:hypothetical protein